MIWPIILLVPLGLLLYRQIKKVEAAEEEELKEFYRNNFEQVAFIEEVRDRVSAKYKEVR